MSERTPYDGQPYYCATCGCGLGEFMACEEVDCLLETKEAAVARATTVTSARVAKLEAALISMTNGANWKSADKDNMEFEGRITCYQLDQARAALKDAPQ